jgi:hypothetical protein
MEQGLIIALIFVGFLTTLLVTASLIEGRDEKRRGRTPTASHEEAA